MAEKVKVFVSDAHYTYEGLVEQLNVLELDLRDGFYKTCASVPEKLLNQFALVDLHNLDRSNRECVCSSKKHLPAILGLTKEGISQSEEGYQKEVFVAIQEDALSYKRRMDEGQLTEEEMAIFSIWLKDAKEEINKIDRGWGTCVINTSEFTNRISGLAGEAVGFTKDEAEKKFMANMRDMARTYTHRLNSADISEKEADSMRDWAREMRRRVTEKIWVGELPKTSRKEEANGADKKPDKKQMMKEAKKVDEDGKKCSTCTTVPDKYKNKDKGSSEKDYVMVTVPTMDGEKQVRVPKQSENQDIQWIVR